MSSSFTVQVCSFSPVSVLRPTSEGQLSVDDYPFGAFQSRTPGWLLPHEAEPPVLFIKLRHGSIHFFFSFIWFAALCFGLFFLFGHLKVLIYGFDKKIKKNGG